MNEQQLLRDAIEAGLHEFFGKWKEASPTIMANVIQECKDVIFRHLEKNNLLDKPLVNH